MEPETFVRAEERPLYQRERIVLRLILLAIRLVASWDIDYRTREFMDEIKRELRKDGSDA